MSRLADVWIDYVDTLSRINKTAGKKMMAYFNMIGGYPETYEEVEEMIRYANLLVMRYGEASASVACEMYDALSALENANVLPAVPADLPSYGEVAKAVNGTLKLGNIEIVAGAIERLVKMPGADTMLKNAIRDHAQYAWIPRGDTCAFCITLASNGWQDASADILDGGHAEHIHANCDCTFAIRHNSETKFPDYDPEKYREMYDNADISSYKWGSTNNDRNVEKRHWQNLSTAKINGMRREFYAKNKEKINAQKRAAYQKRKELNSSKAEEINVN